jgi:hypothetical protein
MASRFAFMAFSAIAVLAQESAASSETNEPNKYTATNAASVKAAQATAPTYTGTPEYKQGRVFDRYVEIWLENTDYDKAAGDANLAWLASKGITLTQYYGVTHP